MFKTKSCVSFLKLQDSRLSYNALREEGDHLIQSSPHNRMLPTSALKEKTYPEFCLFVCFKEKVIGLVFFITSKGPKILCQLGPGKKTDRTYVCAVSKGKLTASNVSVQLCHQRNEGSNHWASRAFRQQVPLTCCPPLINH